ncbi:S-adenosyl-L-methionine-dependent methyltransferase [Aspergillus saccharolyticus JOP 1030-1]|uniref:S-adenosyl-L-methionine-dependent methyltransferase n=1 Tax=Aspergillus saccharolyticus JOP 1030-1 TaxID=1450539 RepID=A0A318Z210_9EURO|nr:S-adenosyl-L-methionine-dependent methyltransferase [Aspergillus saccharolyticus JOP 1030-1]PYH41321.1 S-adenosyl-L-methionine-dependent methyltransferase [Aspergillus saccharolyticus JOP 1030-1]
MPRLANSTILKAYRQSPLLPLLLRECRTLDSARNELRWLRQHAIDIAQERRERDYEAHVAQHYASHSEPRPSPDDPAPTPSSPHRTRRIARARPTGWRRTLRTLCHARSRGTPLQYLLGDQPFGDLTILCRKGVLIPRNDTESFTYAAAEQILTRFPPPSPSNAVDKSPIATATPTTPTPAHPNNGPLRILDLCTGTGCIALLLHDLLAPSYPSLKILGVDINPLAIQLSRRNLHHNTALGWLSTRAPAELEFRLGDVLSTPSSFSGSAHNIAALETILPQIPEFLDPTPLQGDSGVKVDIIISNPPYISREAFVDGTTERSVRVFEPVGALVPPELADSEVVAVGCRGEDVFYARIAGMAGRVGARMVLFECGDYGQGERVMELFRQVEGRWEVRIWEDAMGTEGGEAGRRERACLVVAKRAEG